MKRFLCAAIWAVFGTAAIAQSYPEHFSLTLQVEYAATEDTAANAAPLGIDESGSLKIEMLFPRPSCLARYSTTEASYYATDATLTFANAQAKMDFTLEPKLQIANDLSGITDRVLFALRPEMRLKTGATIERFTLFSDAPNTAFDSNAFIADAGLLQEILEQGGTQARVFTTASGGTADLIMDVVGVEGIEVKRSGGRTPSEFATCVPPAGQP